jgi:hypothetical protein
MHFPDLINQILYINFFVYYEKDFHQLASSEIRINSLGGNPAKKSSIGKAIACSGIIRF